ncbi:Protein of unknown function [Cotesia congregata]|uniref:Vitellogenin domain-containing protein n=1 Tax=Cotesia congregata TaxID=51543 RepID=A0A8J2HM99_COTCN|nr:Protein of unknown function [Cotesia congregata]
MAGYRIFLTGIFPYGKSLIFRYNSEVKADFTEVRTSASHYFIDGQFHITHDTGNQNFDRAFIVTLQNAIISLKNGNKTSEETSYPTGTSDALKVLQGPFGLIFAESGNNTIHGQCKTSYHVQPENSASKNSKIFSVMKFMSPKECSKNKLSSFNFLDVILCTLPEEENSNAASTKVYEFKIEDNNLLLQKLSTHGETSFFPFYHNFKASQVTYSTKLTLESIKPSSEYAGPTINFDSVPSTRDWSYQHTKSLYAENAATDFTEGRHVVDQNYLLNEIKEMLIDAANYFAENHIKTEEPDWQRSKVINNIREALTYLEVSSFHRIFSKIQSNTTPAKKVIKWFFITIVAQVGTDAANLFAFDIIKSKSITDLEAIETVATLPFYVRTPSENLLTQWEEFANSTKALSLNVYKAILLATATMVLRLAEVHNMQGGLSANVLSPILRGVIEVRPRVDYVRLLSIGASLRSLYFDQDNAISILWSMMANTSLPLKLRIGSYNILLQQSRTMTDFLRLHWFMTNEKNEHLYNFHITTLKGFAQSHCPCFAKMHEYSSKILELTPPHSPVSGNLTALYVIDTMNDEGDGLQIKITVVRDEDTEVPEIIYLQQFIMKNHRITSYWALYIQSDGMDNLLKSVNNDFLKFFEGPITTTFIFDFLRKFSVAMTLSKDSFLDILLFYRDQAVMVNYYDHETFNTFNNDVKELVEHFSYLDSYHIFFQNMYEEYVVSDFGVPVVFGASSPAVISLKAQTDDQVAGNLRGIASAKMWLSHDYFVAVYNPINDLWQSAEKLSVVNTDVSYQFEFKNSSDHELLQYIDPSQWDIKFKEANFVIQNQEVVSIKNNRNNQVFKIGNSIFSDEVPSTIENLNSNSVAFTDNGNDYEAELFNCQNQLTNLTNSEYIKILPRWENYDSFMFPLSSQIKNCGNIIKITPSS